MRVHKHEGFSPCSPSSAEYRKLCSIGEKDDQTDISVRLFELMRKLRFDNETDEAKMSFVLRCFKVMENARRIHRETGGQESMLKPIADECRRLLWELPDQVPAKGYGYIPDGDVMARCEYRDSLSLEEIEQRILGTVELYDLTEWFKFAAKREHYAKEDSGRTEATDLQAAI